jgi:outer membrane protein OmpA-like peptidoglycan-associated protein
MARARRDSLHVWPAFTDLMSGLAILLLLFGLRETERATTVARERDKLTDKVKELGTQLAQLTHDLEVEHKAYRVQRELAEQIQQTLKTHSIDASINALGTLEISADMLFATNQSDIPDERQGRANLVGDALVRLLRDPTSSSKVAMIMVVGHTDQDGHAAENLTLSTKRAVALIEVWRKQYFPDSETYQPERCIAAKIVASGMGESRPLIANEDVGHEPGNDCENQPTDYTGCRKNRRIEIRVIPKDERAVEIARCK